MGWLSIHTLFSHSSVQLLRLVTLPPQKEAAICSVMSRLVLSLAVLTISVERITDWLACIRCPLLHVLLIACSIAIPVLSWCHPFNFSLFSRTILVLHNSSLQADCLFLTSCIGQNVKVSWFAYPLKYPFICSLVCKFVCFCSDCSYALLFMFVCICCSVCMYMGMFYSVCLYVLICMFVCFALYVCMFCSVCLCDAFRCDSLKRLCLCFRVEHSLVNLLF